LTLETPELTVELLLMPGGFDVESVATGTFTPSFGIVVAMSVALPICSKLDPVSAGMAPRPFQPPTLSRMGNEYQPKCASRE